MRLLLLAAIAAAPVVLEHGRLVLKSAAGNQTVSMLDGGRTGLYYDVGERVGQLRPRARRVVLLGLGGGEMLRATRRTLPSAELVGVELEPEVAAAARANFGIEQLGVDVVVMDAARYVDQVHDSAVDAYLVDVYDDAVVPEYFRTVAFFRACRRGLVPRGLLIMNVDEGLAPAVRAAMREAGFTATRLERYAPANVEVFAER